MLRRSTCGNICCILCTATSLDLINCSAVLMGGRSGRGPEKKRYRTISPDTSRTMAKNGSEICSSDMATFWRPQLRRRLTSVDSELESQDLMSVDERWSFEFVSSDCAACEETASSSR